MPLELFSFGLESTLARLGEAAELRPDTPRSPDGGVIADYTADFDDPVGSASLDDLPPQSAVAAKSKPERR